MLLYREEIMLIHSLKIRSKGAYTILEVIVVLIILGATASFAIPKLTMTLERSRSSEGVKILEALLVAQRMHDYEGNATQYSSTLGALDVTIDDPSENFENHTPFNDPLRVAETTRSGGASGLYTLRVSESGDISCGDEDSSANGWCKKLGYATY